MGALAAIVCSAVIGARAADAWPQTDAVRDPVSLLDDASILKKGDLLSVQIMEDNSKPKVLQVITTFEGAGNVQFPYVGLVKAEGLTPKKLAGKYKALLEKHYFKTATVTIKLMDPEELKPSREKKPPGGQN